MRSRINQVGHALTGFFVLILISVFALLSLLLTILGAKDYRAVVSATNSNAGVRTSVHYILNRLRSGDESGHVRIERHDDRDELVLVEEHEGVLYENRIYCYGGYLMELFSLPGDNLSAEDGDKLTPMEEMHVQKTGENLYQIILLSKDGKMTKTHFSLRSTLERRAN